MVDNTNASSSYVVGAEKISKAYGCSLQSVRFFLAMGTLKTLGFSPSSCSRLYKASFAKPGPGGCGTGAGRALGGTETLQASFKGTLLGTPNREPQEYSRNIMEYKDPGRYIPIIYLLYSWGSLFGVPSRVPLSLGGADPGRPVGGRPLP